MNKLDLETIGSNLRRCIKEFNSTHDEKFSECFERACIDGEMNLTDYNIIYRYQSGKKRPSLLTLVVLANLLNVSPDELLS